MAGATFLPGETKVRPGVYVRATNVGEPQLVSSGIVAALFRASWGPLGIPTVLDALDLVASTFGSGGATDTALEAFRGGAQQVLAYRLGTGGQVATLTLTDGATTPENVVTIDAKYVGTRGNTLRVTVRDALADATRRELLIHEGTTLRQRIEYTAGTDEAQALVDAIASIGSDWITATKLSAGDGSLADVNQQPLTSGTDPTIDGTAYSTALTAIEALDWNVLAVDSDDVTVHATVKAYVDRVRDEGKRVLAVVGEPTSVSLSTRLANAKALDDYAIVYVANGFRRTDGTVVEGYRAAARVAGMIAGSAITDSLTHATVAGATELVGALTGAEIESAIRSGAVVFSVGAQRQVQIEYGITTLTTLTADLDAGWKKIRRVRTRDRLMDLIAARWDALIGRVNNNPDGRAALIAAAQGIINQMIADGALLDGTITEDPANPPSGDSAWFVVQVDDVDSAEKLYLTFGFRFAPAA